MLVASADYWLLAIGYWLLAIGYWLLENKIGFRKQSYCGSIALFLAKPKLRRYNFNKPFRLHALEICSNISR